MAKGKTSRSPRTSSGIRAEQKARRREAQEARQQANLDALGAIPGGEQYRFKTDAKGVNVTLRPSKALRRAQRAKRFTQRG